MSRLVLVTGATGLTGSLIVRRLSARGIRTRALVRDAERAKELARLPHVELAVGDMGQHDTLAPALEGVTRAMLISSSAPDMRDVQSSFIDAAKKTGVPHVVKLSGIMPELDSAFRFARMHGEIEKHLESSGMAWTHLRAGEFMHSYFRQVPSIVSKQSLFLPMADAKIASIDVGDIAEAATIALTTEGHAGKIHPLTGAEALTMTEVAERLSRVLGKTIRYVAVSPEDAKKARLAAGVPQYLSDALDELFAERRNGKEAAVHPTLENVFGIRPMRFEDFATKHSAVFRGS